MFLNYLKPILSHLRETEWIHLKGPKQVSKKKVSKDQQSGSWVKNKPL